MKDDRPETGDLRARIEQQRPYLLRFAALQLRDPNAAEDAVQETLLAALAGEAKFAGRSNLRTWLTGILKHKIVDSIRRAAREPSVEIEDAGEFDALFRGNGHWLERPAAWSEPQGALEQKQFFAVLEQCLARLPEKTARVFMMREHLGLETEQICKELGITPTHCWVLLYRARMSLRLCLDERWFQSGSEKADRKK
ncbi:MAG: sigma-70 family RNA polymerase sigma factor [Burkholderiales bacterium]|nr:sigma-70 family RNA polymerase sigma factor [Burkholderiales bacterium]